MYPTCSMLFKTNGFFVLVLGAALGSCGSDQSRPPIAQPPATAPSEVLSQPLPRAASVPAGSGLAGLLGPIRTNFRRINTIGRWSSVVTRDLEEPGEGGEATFYYADKRLEKVVARHFGEMGQRQVDYYLLNGQLSFVLEKAYRYNRPMYYDSTAMQQAHDTEAFAFDSSAVAERRSYFAQNRLVHQIPRSGPDAPVTQSLQQEQERINAEFQAALSSR